MKLRIAFAFALVGLLTVASASAVPLTLERQHFSVQNDVTDVQYSRGGSWEFRRCMRAKYGPNYFRRVPRAHRFHMVQACGG